VQINRTSDLTRTAFQLLALGALVISSFWIVQPFLVALTWASTIVVATWPVLLRVQRALGGRRSLAVAVMTGALLLVLVMPLYFGAGAIVGNAKQIADWSQALATMTIPQPPGWVEGLPLIGAKLAERWQQFAAEGSAEVLTRLSPFINTLVVWFVGQIGGLGLLLVEFLLTVIVAAILYVNGETAAWGAVRFARRLAGPEAENALHLAGQAIRGVALGVVVTAIVQSAAAGIGLVLVGVPFATILTAVIFMLCIAQLGPALVLLPAVVWVYATSGTFWGIVFLVWSIFCATFDSFLRPMLIKRGADLPVLLIFTGVLGGLIAFGVIGLFIGPVVLAVAYTLLVEWVGNESDPANEQAPPSPTPRTDA